MFTFPTDFSNIPTSGTCVIAGQGVHNIMKCPQPQLRGSGGPVGIHAAAIYLLESNERVSERQREKKKAYQTFGRRQCEANQNSGEPPDVTGPKPCGSGTRCQRRITPLGPVSRLCRECAWIDTSVSGCNMCAYMVYGCGGGRESRTEKNDIATIILYITRGGRKNIIYKTKLNQQRSCANHIGVQTVYITVIVERVMCVRKWPIFFFWFLKHPSINYLFFMDPLTRHVDDE